MSGCGTSPAVSVFSDLTDAQPWSMKTGASNRVMMPHDVIEWVFIDARYENESTAQLDFGRMSRWNPSDDKCMLALSIRQPFAELILRGIKTVELRTKPTRIIGERFWIYASKRRGKKGADAESRLTTKTGL
jgi:hypothetical protein